MTEISYDVFISHAYEDDTAFANELAFALKKKGLKIWYSGFELKPGDGITESVNNALKTATFGIIIISPIYLEKQWAMDELKSLFTQKSAIKTILPILHNITTGEIKEHLPLPANRYVASSEKGLRAIVTKTMQVIKGKGNKKNGKKGTSSAKNKISEKATTKNSDSGFITLGSAIMTNVNRSDRKK